MNKVYGIFINDGFTKDKKSGNLLHLFIAKENAEIEMSRLQYDYPDHYFFMKPIELVDA